MALIIIIEGDGQLRRMACRALTLHGHEAVGAADASDAMQLVDGFARPPDVLVMDLELQDSPEGGPARLLRTQPWGVPVIYMSRYTSRDNGATVIADWLLLKPFSVPELLAAVEDALAARRKKESA